MNASKRPATSLQAIGATEILVLVIPINGVVVAASTDSDTMTIWRRIGPDLFKPIHALPWVETSDARFLMLGEAYDKAAEAVRLYAAGELGQ
ncbi:hypothetical protein [Microbulbifer sp. PSTR4-B]|uniref:hypothetical protein n=1 Tax=unclassified Microbulbifer TaxID=2619833 RepID=UPI00403AB77E